MKSIDSNKQWVVDILIQELRESVEAGYGYVAFDHARYTPMELDIAITGFADMLGWSILDESRKMLQDDMDLPDDDPRKASYLRTWAEGATDWLNKNIAPKNSSFYHDGHQGAFGCWPHREEMQP